MTERLTDEEWELARSVCTARQLQALAWHRQGYGYKRIAAILERDPASVRGLIARARRRLIAALEDVAA